MPMRGGVWAAGSPEAPRLPFPHHPRAPGVLPPPTAVSALLDGRCRSNWKRPSAYTVAVVHGLVAESQTNPMLAWHYSLPLRQASLAQCASCEGHSRCRCWGKRYPRQ